MIHICRRSVASGKRFPRVSSFFWRIGNEAKQEIQVDSIQTFPTRYFPLFNEPDWLRLCRSIVTFSVGFGKIFITIIVKFFFTQNCYCRCQRWTIDIFLVCFQPLLSNHVFLTVSFCFNCNTKFILFLDKSTNCFLFVIFDSNFNFLVLFFLNIDQNYFPDQFHFWIVVIFN